MKKKISVLLVEDNKDDAATIRQAFYQNDSKIKFEHTANGEEALDYLGKNHKHLPGIIVLDLEMPVMNGFVLLNNLRSHDLYKSIPVVVLTGHNDEYHRTGSFEHNVAGFMEKPADFKGYEELIKNIIAYWSLSELTEKS